MPKYFEKRHGGGNVSYHPIKTGDGGAFVTSDLLILKTELRHFNIAFTPFCPLHATNVHAAATCRQWQAKLAAQLQAKRDKSAAADGQTNRRADRNEQASSSRDTHRNTY